MNSEIPDAVKNFLKDEFILSFSCRSGESLHSVTVYYSFCEKLSSVIFASQGASEHSRILKSNPLTAGSIYRSTRNVLEIQGIQFTGRVSNLSAQVSRSSDSDECISNYLKTFPESCNIDADFWQINFDYIKFTDNTHSFGHKLIWQRTL